jgi:2-dehydropantoate 2-reductase
MSWPKTIAILGTGAVGSYYGAKLALSGRDVRFLARSDLGVLRAEGLRVVDGKTSLHLFPVSAYASPESLGACDLVLISVKATANAALPTLLPPLLGSKTVIMTLQNGLGNEEFLSAHFPKHRIFGGLCFVCLNRVAKGVVEHYGYGKLAIAEFHPRKPCLETTLQSMWQEAGIPCEVSPSLAEARWRKLLWNIPFNGLSIASGGLTVDRILQSPALRREALALMNELIVVAEKLEIGFEPGLPEKLIADTEKMGSYHPSSLLDWMNGRDVEVEAIFHEPLRQARKAGMEPARLAMLFALLESVCASR